MKAVSYLASYLARAKFISSSLVASILKRFENISLVILSIFSLYFTNLSGQYFVSWFRLVDWCFEYCQYQDSQEKKINPQAHRVFYSGCQVIFLIFLI